MFEGRLGGHYNDRRPEVVLTISYSIPSSTELKVNKTDAVTDCLFRIFTIKQVILKCNIHT